MAEMTPGAGCANQPPKGKGWRKKAQPKPNTLVTVVLDS